MLCVVDFDHCKSRRAQWASRPLEVILGTAIGTQHSNKNVGKGEKEDLDLKLLNVMGACPDKTEGMKARQVIQVWEREVDLFLREEKK